MFKKNTRGGRCSHTPRERARKWSKGVKNAEFFESGLQIALPRRNIPVPVPVPRHFRRKNVFVIYFAMKDLSGAEFFVESDFWGVLALATLKIGFAE